MKPRIEVQCCVSDDVMARNAGLCPEYPEPAGHGNLAVVGGGHSASDHVDELRSWDGEVWAINGTWQWCRDNGIDAAFMSADPQKDQIDLVKGVKRAVLAAHTEPEVWPLLCDADVRVFRYGVPGPTSAVAASLVAIKSGWRHVTYFGCESSFGETTHTFKNEMHDIVRVVSGDKPFLTKLEFILQAEQLASIIRALPQFYSERSGGLLAALIEHNDWDMTHGSPSIAARMRYVEAGGGCPFPESYGAVFG